MFWDACLLISWVTDEKRADGAQTAGLEAVRTEFMNGQTCIVASTLSRTEVFRFRLTDEQKKKYADFFRRENAIECAVTGPIAEKAASIRAKTEKVREDGQSEFMKTPDAVHLATAIIMGVDEFQTWDGSAKKPRDFPLIPLSGTPIVDGMRIVVPAVTPEPQLKLELAAPKPAGPSST